MLRLSDTALWRAGRRWAWAGGFGLLLSGTTSAIAQDCAPACAAPDGCAPACAAPISCDPACAAPVECAPACAAPYGCTSTYDAMTQSATGCSSVVGSCCETGCDGGGCGEGCGLGDGFSLMDLFDCGDKGCDSGCDVDSCDGGGCCGGGDGPTIGGWVQFGYHDASTGQFNNRPGQFANHQSWLYVEQAADGSDGLGFGYRADLMYGLDADDTQAFGNNPGNFDFQDGSNNFFNRGAYGWAIPQLYAEAAYGDFSVIAGHFYTLLGYEVVTAPDNFFYSHAFTMYNAEAFTHTGVLSTYSASDDVTLYNGYTFGWDTGFDQFQDEATGANGSNYLGGASVALTDSLTLTYINTVGDLGAIGKGYTQSIVADFAVSDDLNYVFQSDYYDVENDGFTTQFYGVNQYLFYTLTDEISVGGRAEWFKVDGDSIYEVTGGVNIKPTDNLIIRPEYRYQFGDADGFANLLGDDVAVDEGIFGIDAIVTF